MTESDITATSRTTPNKPCVNLQPIYKLVAKKCGKKDGKDTSLVTKADETRCGSEYEVLARWAEYYECAFNHPAVPPCQSLDGLASCARSDEGIALEPPTLSEVCAAIKRLKNGKAVGSDGITAELLRHSIDCTGPALCSQYGKVWSTGRVPVQWKDGIIVPLYKGKGPKGDCNSYESITLLLVPGKVFAHVLQRRIESLLMEKRKPQQSGFTPGRSFVRCSSGSPIAIRSAS